MDSGSVAYVSGSLLAALVFGSWLGMTAVRRWPLPRTPLDWPIVLVLIAAAASVSFGAYPRLASEQLFFLVGLVLLFYLLLDLLPVQEPNLGFVLRGSVFGMGAVFGAASLVGVLDWYLGLGIWWAGPGWLQIGGWADLWPPRAPRVGLGNIVWPTVHGGALVFVFGLSLPQAFAATGRQRILWGGYLALLAAGLFFTYARGAWLAAAAVAALVVIAAGRIHRADARAGPRSGVEGRIAAAALSSSGAMEPACRRSSLLASIPTSLFALLLVGGIGAAAALLATGRGVSSDEFRLELARIALDVFADQPVFGGGVGIFPYLMLAHWTPSMVITRPREHAHNAYLNQLAEQGIFGVLATGTLIVVLLLMLGRARHLAADPKERLRALSPFAALGVFAVHGLFDAPLSQAGLAVAAVFALALATVEGGHLERAVPTLSRSSALTTPATVLSACLRPSRSKLFGLLIVALSVALWYQPATTAQGVAAAAAAAGDYRTAAAQLERATALDSGFGLYHQQLGEVYLWLAAMTGDSGRLPRARDSLSQALERSPRMARLHALMGLTSQELGEHDRAVAELTRAVELDPLDTRYQVALGAALLPRDPEAGMVSFVRALAQWPELFASDYWQHLSDERRGELYRRALDLISVPEGRSPGQRQDLIGRLALAAGDLDRAELAFWSAGSDHGLGQVAFRRGDYGAARRHFDAVVRREPGSYVTLNRGEAALALGDLDGAERDFRRAAFAAIDNVFLASTVTEVRYQLGRVAEARGQLDVAINHYEHGLPRSGRILGYEPNVWRRPALPAPDPPQLAAYDIVRTTPAWRAPYGALAAAYERAGRADLAEQLRAALAAAGVAP